jgi:hypothetical protein
MCLIPAARGYPRRQHDVGENHRRWGTGVGDDAT